MITTPLDQGILNALPRASVHDLYAAIRWIPRRTVRQRLSQLVDARLVTVDPTTQVIAITVAGEQARLR